MLPPSTAQSSNQFLPRSACQKAKQTVVFVGALLVLAFCRSLTTTPTPSTSSSLTATNDIAHGRIVTNQDEYPFVVDMEIEKDGWLYTCSGVIIGQNWVLTAAHCVDGAEPRGVLMVAGSVERSPRTYGAQSRTATRFEFHEQYRSKDVALVRTNAPFTFTNAVRAIPIGPTRPPVGTHLSAMGWGTISKNGPATNELRMATMYVISNDDCRTTDTYEICTQGGSGNTCGGDSGGPLVWSRKGISELVGLNSWSYTNCDDLEGNIDVFEATASYLTWVNGIVGNSQCSSVPPEYRHDCGFPGVNATTCRAKNCCWDATIPDSMWCFSPTNTEENCALGEGVREICEEPYESACVQHGCCWEESEYGEGTCYQPKLANRNGYNGGNK